MPAAVVEEVRALPAHAEGAMAVLPLQRAEQRLQRPLGTVGATLRQRRVEPSCPAVGQHRASSGSQREVDALAVLLVGLPPSGTATSSRGHGG